MLLLGLRVGDASELSSVTRLHSGRRGGGCFVKGNDNACHADGTNYLVQQEGGTNWAKGG